MNSSEISKAYDAYYYAHGCGTQPYERNPGWLRFFDSVAAHIVRGIQPHTVLDAGCAIGLLVETLRDRGVDAQGIDISEWAIQHMPEALRPYCRVGSILEPFPQRYDLIVTIEVLEHLSADQAEPAIANCCQHTDQVLFSSTPLDYKEATHFNVQPPEYWAELFAQQGYYRDVDFDASFLTPWAALFRKGRVPLPRIVGAYERHYWKLRQENVARRDMNLEQRNELAAKDESVRRSTEQVALAEKQLQDLRERLQRQDRDLANWAARWARLENSLGGRVLKTMQNMRGFIAPPRSLRDQILDNAWQRFVLRKRARRMAATPLPIEAVTVRAALSPHQATVEVIICVHNALDDVRSCLESVVAHSTPPYSLILVDDASDTPTQDYLRQFAAEKHAVLIRHDAARGYTFSANVGLRSSLADYSLLLNSDTIVSADWLDRLVACAESNPRCGLIGPLSNTASWQSIPSVEVKGDWAENPLPSGLSVDDVARLVAQYSARLYPVVPLLNGFCYMIRRAVIEQIGYLDEENFGPGYGEEDDYTLRARQAGWQAAIADDVYVYHAQSRSYSNETRRVLSEKAGQRLAQKHGMQIIMDGVAFCRHHKVLEGIRARSEIIMERESVVVQGRDGFAGKRLLFLLPIIDPGGGGNVVIDEALAMRQMGVEVALFNHVKFRDAFERAYPELQLPVIYGEPERVAHLSHDYDAVVATVNFTVEWLASIPQLDGRPVRGYYVQGFEPYIYQVDTLDYERALRSYTLLPDLVRFTKTQWTHDEVKQHTGAECHVIGASLKIDLFRPRPAVGPEWPQRPLRIAAMVRPSTPYREPKLTMEILRRADQQYGQRVEIMAFGTTPDEVKLADLPINFNWKLAGVLNQQQVARLMNDVDIFVDYSSHQAMGLTALEAMACGAAAIVPLHGGAVSFARHGENSLIVDTASLEECWRALQRLIEDDDLRQRLQRQALRDVCQLYPERAAFNILTTLFGSTA